MDWQALLLGGLNLLVVAVLIPLSRSVTQLRANEVYHLQESLDRIEKRLDDHVTYHLTKGL